MASFLKLAASQISSIWGRIGLNQKITIVAVLVVLVGGLLGLSFWAKSPDYGLVFKNLAPDEMAEMISALADEQIPYRTAKRGTVLMAPVGDVGRARIALASHGLPKRRPGFEIFDRTNLGITDFVQHVNFVRALEGELAKTISSLEEVEEARVHIVKPEQSLFVKEQKPATASVWVRVSAGAQLSHPQVSGIVQLVANSVEGLQTANVSVVDQHGRELAKQLGPELEATNAQLDARRNIEKYLSAKAQDMLDQVLGPNKSRVEVSAELNFKRVTEQSKSHDPEGRVAIEEKTTSNEEQPAQRVAAGPPGTASNTTRISSTASVALTQRSDMTEEKKYLCDEVVRTTTEAMGDVDKLWVAATIDYAQKQVTDKDGNTRTRLAPRTAEDITHLGDLIKRAVGFVEGRDEFQITNMPFASTRHKINPQALAAEQRRKLIVSIVKHGSVAVAVLAFILFFWLSRRPAGRPQPALAGALGTEAGMALGEGKAQGQPGALGAPDMNKPVPVSEPAQPPRKLPRDILNEHVAADPKSAAGVIRRWINEEDEDV